jgi:hypothetical protein
MPVSITFRTDGAWGSGIGVDLSAGQVDSNFYSLKQAVEALETDRPQPNNIASITANASGTQWVVHLDDGTALGPLPIPVLQFRDRGEWTASTLYEPLDVFTVAGTGLFSVLTEHTSASSFDESAAGAAVVATAIVENGQYKIASVGTTDFTLIGADSNTVGLVFIATDTGTGTGTAGPLLYHKLIGSDTSTAIADLADVDAGAADTGFALIFRDDVWTAEPHGGPVVDEAGTARTLALADAEKYIRTSSASNVTIAIPSEASVAFPVGTTIAFEQAAAGTVTVVEGESGVTLNCHAALTPTTAGEFAVAQIKKVGGDEWTIFGNLVPA